nr:immunoglobulin heavy chain junction region [Macaca mulatta]
CARITQNRPPDYLGLDSW